MPKRWFHADRFPFRSYDAERNGEIYQNLGIRWWKDRLPDMSRIFPKWIPSKRIVPGMDCGQIIVMIQETCVAELVHGILSALGLVCLWIWPGPGGVIVFLIWVVVGNIPYIMIQRYNRPRLMRLEERMARTDMILESSVAPE